MIDESQLNGTGLSRGQRKSYHQRELREGDSPPPGKRMRGIMSTNPQHKRVTKQIRVSEHLHRKIKLEAINQGKTISRFIDKIIEKYFAHENEPEN